MGGAHWVEGDGRTGKAVLPKGAAESMLITVWGIGPDLDRGGLFMAGSRLYTHQAVVGYATSQTDCPVILSLAGSQSG